MSKTTYRPERGDVVVVNFYPAAGREIDKRRPAIVISDTQYNRASGFCIVVPTSTNLAPGPMWYPIPNGLLDRPSVALCDFARSVDYRERNVAFVAKAPKALVDEVVMRLIELVDPAYRT
ncbi:MAG TPA: type II toxin-antitoxin system PemK/MazF family toxin [Tepidisphaeraceae bacterium]